jgi:hypothetical protein
MKLHIDSRYLKFIIPLIIILGWAFHMHAQNTATLTGTVTDPSSQAWASATWIANLNNPAGGTPMYSGSCGASGTAPRSFTGQLDTTGTFVSGAVVGRTSCIIPAGTSWTYTLLSLTSAPGQTVGPITISGTTFDLGSAASASITAPVVPSTNLSYAYNDTEIVDPVNGNGYVNTIINSNFLYNNGWVKIAGGGCTGSSVTGNVAFNNQVGNFESGCLASVGNPFGVSISCSAAGSFEIGFVTTNPNTCSFSYSNGTPASGNLHDSQSDTVTLVSPFTTGVLPFAYSTNQAFVVQAVSISSQTASASQTLSFSVREFAGIGTPGATGATASGNTAILVGATGTLATVGLGQHSTWGPFSPSNQSIYILGTGASCSFTAAGFAFPMNTPTAFSFTNQFGTPVSMFLYQSTNLLSAPFTLNGTC